MSEQISDSRRLNLSFIDSQAFAAAETLVKLPFRRAQITAAKIYAHIGMVTPVEKIIARTHLEGEKADLLLADAFEARANLYEQSPAARMMFLDVASEEGPYIRDLLLNEPGIITEIIEKNRAAARRFREKYQPNQQ